MATIKEKAEEYSFIRQGIGPSGIQYRDFSINKKYAFIAGANYVLDEIEKSLQEFSNYEDSLIISRIIEQLKK